MLWCLLGYFTFFANSLWTVWLPHVSCIVLAYQTVYWYILKRSYDKKSVKPCIDLLPTLQKIKINKKKQTKKHLGISPIHPSEHMMFIWCLNFDAMLWCCIDTEATYKDHLPAGMRVLLSKFGYLLQHLVGDYRLLCNTLPHKKMSTL